MQSRQHPAAAAARLEPEDAELGVLLYIPPVSSVPFLMSVCIYLICNTSQEIGDAHWYSFDQLQLSQLKVQPITD